MKDELFFRLGLGLFSIAVAVLWTWIYPWIGLVFFMAGVAMVQWSLYVDDDED